MKGVKGYWVALGLYMAALVSTLVPTLVPAAQAAEPTREQALRQLADAQAALRLAAVQRLAVVGRFADNEALAKRLLDDDDKVREAAQATLWTVWAKSGDAKVDALYKKGVAQMAAGQAGAAIATFSEIIRLRPAFAEAWNKRATLYYFVKRYAESLADCDEVMKRNPFHFGALSGYGQIYTQLEDYDKALEYFEKALAVNPGMEGVAMNILALRKLRAERSRRAT